MTRDAARVDDLTVGMPTFEDDPDVLVRSLDAIGAQGVTEPPLIVDSSRTERVAEVVCPREHVRYVRAREATGVAESRNRIVELCRTRYLLFIDADAVPRPGWAAAMRRAFDRGDNVWLVGARIVPVWKKPPPPLFDCIVARELLGMLDLGSHTLEIPRVMGTSYAVDCRRVPEARPFDPRLGRRPDRLLSGEEVQLSLDVLSSGGRITYEPAATVEHHVRPERMRWRWMLARVYSEGRESRLWPQRLDPFPRRLGAADRVFQLVSTPAFLAGRWRGLNGRLTSCEGGESG